MVMFWDSNVTFNENYGLLGYLLWNSNDVFKHS